MADEILVPLEPDTLGGLLIAEEGSSERLVVEEGLVASQTSYPLFIVAGVMDLTNFIVVPSYQVNLQDVYEEWDDNNLVHHRDLKALKCKGSFQIKFETLEQFQAFMIVMKECKKSNRSYDCTVYCTNMLEPYTTEMFIDFDPPNVMPFIGAKDYDPIDITVEERANQYVRD